MRPLISATALVLGVAFRTSATPVNTSSIPSIGSSTVTADSSKTTARAVITTRQATPPEVPAAYKTTMTVKNVVDVIDITVDGHSVIVSADAYCWIFNPNEAVLDLRGRRMTLSIRGGDGINSYVVKLYFDSKRVTRKTVGGLAGIGSDTKYYLRVLEDVPAIEPDNGDTQGTRQ